MSNYPKVVGLLKNEHYPTYQFYAQMQRKSTTPENGLVIAIRETLEWLLQRLGDNAEDALREIAGREDPMESYHTSCGYVIDIVAIPEQGTWTLQITEPDLGSEPGNPNQSRPPVPGRVIQTNVAFAISNGTVECGFQTLISEPTYAKEDAEVYRLAPVRFLMDNPSFGFRHITEITDKVTDITSLESLKNVITMWHDDDNQLPSVLFTKVAAEKETEPNLDELSAILKASQQKLGFQMKPFQTDNKKAQPFIQAEPKQTTRVLQASIEKKAVEESVYDADSFAKSLFTFCRTYLVDVAFVEKMKAELCVSVNPGDIVILEPDKYGGKKRIIPYSPLKSKREAAFAALKKEMYAYPRRKSVSFGNVAFLSAAHLNREQQAEEMEEQTKELLLKSEQKMLQREAELKSELAMLEEQNDQLSAQLDRAKLYQARLEQEKEDLRYQTQQEIEKAKAEVRLYQEESVFLRRKLSRPQDHSGITAWVEANFSDRLFMHQKAKDLLLNKEAKSVPLELICDALDFLATDYWDARYARIGTDEMKLRCSEKYGRPFEVKPTGNTTVEYTPTEYKIKYYIGQRGKPVETPLDWHLGVGSDPENQLRIYFLHDDKKQLIVIGSLPKHLRAVTIQ